MDVTFTTHPKDGPGKFYMAVAEADEWGEIAEELELVASTGGLSTSARRLLDQLKSWGIEA